MDQLKNNRRQTLPAFFKPLFWSYNFALLDSDKSKKTIILSAINYGDLRHWRWINNRYGKKVVREILESVPSTELKKRAARLAELIFAVKLNHAPRGTH